MQVAFTADECTMVYDLLPDEFPATGAWLYPSDNQLTGQPTYPQLHVPNSA